MSDAWLVAVDMQEIFRDRGSEWVAPRFDEAAVNVARLAEAFGPRSVFTRFVAPARPAGAWQPYYERFPFALQPPEAALYQIADALEPLAHTTVEAHTFGKWGADLEAVVGEQPDLVVCGVATDCCVLSTVLAAADAGARVTIVPDACAGSSDDNHAKAVAVMALYEPLVSILGTDELLRTLAA